jgi:hypothetical protein
MYIISLLLLEILMLKNSTTFLLFEVQHTFHLNDIRINYFNQELVSLITAHQHIFITNVASLDEVLNTILVTVNYEQVCTLNAEQIHEYALDIANQYLNPTPLLPNFWVNLSTFGQVSSITYIIYYYIIKPLYDFNTTLL